MIIVADSSALVALAIADCLVLLDQLYEEVKVPKAVFDECTHGCNPLDTTIKAPSVLLPENACDCHYHIFDEPSPQVYSEH